MLVYVFLYAKDFFLFNGSADVPLGMKCLRLVQSVVQDTARSRQEFDVACAMMSDRSDVEMFILTAVCEEIGRKKIKTKKKRLWIDYIFVSRCNQGELHAPFEPKTAQRPRATHARVLYQPPSCLRFWRRRCIFGCRLDWL